MTLERISDGWQLNCEEAKRDFHLMFHQDEEGRVYSSRRKEINMAITTHGGTTDAADKLEGQSILAPARGSASPTDYEYHVNQGKAWKEGTPRIDVQQGLTWVVDEHGYVVFLSHLKDKDGRVMAETNLEEAKRFFAKYYSQHAETPNTDLG